MITVVFENGAVSKLNNVYKMTVDEEDLDKIFVDPNIWQNMAEKIKKETADNPVISVDFSVGDCDTCIFSDACVSGEEICFREGDV